MRTAEERVTVRHPVASTSLSMYPPQVPVISPTMFGRDPNISGEGSLANNIGLVRSSGVTTGCVTKGTSFQNSAHAVTDLNANALKIDASINSAEYINDGHLQPSALQCLVCIKI